MVVEEGLLILPIIPLTLVIGLYELFAIHADMSFRGSHWLGHGLGTLIPIAIGLFITLNTEYFIQMMNITYEFPLLGTVWSIRVLTGIILNFKIHAQSSLARGGGGIAARGLAEHWTHTLIISILVVLAPLVWPLIAGYLPFYLGGSA